MIASLDRIAGDRLRSTFAAIHPPPLAVEDAGAILALAQLVVDIDGREGPDEIKLFFEIGRIVNFLAGQADAEVPTHASADDDEERMFELATSLSSVRARELAYGIARVLASSDLEVAPEEDVFIDRLRGVLSIDKARAAELDAQVR